MAKLNEAACIDELIDIFDAVVGLTPPQIIHGITAIGGKLYELYCVARLLEHLQSQHGMSATFVGTALILKTSGGYVYSNDPHFEIWSAGSLVGKLFTDIEVGTLGVTHGATPDLSAYHEIDIVLLSPIHAVYPHRPRPDQLLFGVECKATADFCKSHVREVLGRRRELSFFRPYPIVGPFGPINAAPPAPYWLVYIDPDGDNYKNSPEFFGITLACWKP